MDTTTIGKRAEDAALMYLVTHGYTPLCRNWRRPMYEIDLVVGRDRVVYFVEVKYRRHAVAGSGLDAIGHDKLRRMSRAARAWSQEYRWTGEVDLMAVEVSGMSYSVTACVDIR